MSDTAQQNTAPSGKSGYDGLKFYFQNLYSLFSIRKMLAMDMMTAMPQGGLSRRIYDISSITRRIYAETTTPTIAMMLDEAEDGFNANPGEWNDWDKANLREMRRIHNHLAALPADVYTACARFASEGRKRHAIAVEKQSWSEAKIYIQQVVDLYRQVADLKQQKFGTKSLYEALLLGYADDISVEQIDGLYEGLFKPLISLKDRALEIQSGMDTPTPLEGTFSRNEQMWLNHSVLELMGFNFNNGGLYITRVSPMAGGSPEDARVLVRCSDSDTFLDSLEDTLYQGARGIYLQNLPSEWRGQPVGQELGSVITSALSLFYETIIGRTPQFFKFVSARAEGLFQHIQDESFEPENLYRLKKIVTPSRHRDNADELTKIFHDIMRYQIERDLINGTLKVDDLPERWNEETKRYLGLETKSNADSILQNPDWFTGRFGFIPTNTLSHIIAAELHDALYNQHKDLPQRIEKGDLGFIGKWVNENIHSKGRSVGAMELIQSITGKDLSEKHLLEHLERRYLSYKK